MCGITIGENSIVGAGSLVTKDVPPNTIVAGNPSRILRKLNGNENHAAELIARGKRIKAVED
jgi:acetyltransferase-like isoleucine patch superfamily enzyme